MSSPKKVASPIIGYVHNLSNLKQGKKTRWCDMQLQLKGDVRKRVVCFSKAKRDIFEAKQQTLSAVKISNYVVSKGLTGESEEILVNDMTNVVAAGPSEYSFQYIPDQQPEIVSLNEVRRSIEIGEKVTIKGRIKKGENLECVGARNLQMLRSVIFDGTDNLYITLWESEIESVSEGTVYVVSNVNVKMNDLVKILSTTPQTIFTEVDGDELEDLDDSVAIQMLEESGETTVLAQAFRSVDADKYHCCVHCSKKLTPGLETKVVKCTRCYRRMRLQDCELNVSCRVTIVVGDDQLQLSMFANVLSTLLDAENVGELSEDVIAEELLDLEDIHIKYKDNIILSASKV